VTGMRAAVGEILKFAVEVRGATQAQIADHVGKSKATVSKWLSGKHDPDAASMFTLIVVYGVPDEKWRRSGTSRPFEAPRELFQGTLQSLLKDANRVLDRTFDCIENAKVGDRLNRPGGKCRPEELAWALACSAEQEAASTEENALVLRVKGRCFTDRGNHEVAARFYHQALKLTDDPLLEAALLHNLALGWMVLGLYPVADSYLLGAQRTLERLDHRKYSGELLSAYRKTVGFNLVVRGRMLLEQSFFAGTPLSEKAVALLGQAVNRFIEAEMPGFTYWAQVFHGLATVLAAAGADRRAGRKRGRQLIERAAERARAEDDWETEGWGHFARIISLLHCRERAEALVASSQAMKFISKHEHSELLIYIAMARALAIKAFASTHKGMDFSDEKTDLHNLIRVDYAGTYDSGAPAVEMLLACVDEDNGGNHEDYN